MCAKENKDINVTLILEKVKDYFGFVPKIFQVLSENPVALKVFFDKAEFMMADDSLPPLTKNSCLLGQLLPWDRLTVLLPIWKWPKSSEPLMKNSSLL